MLGKSLVKESVLKDGVCLDTGEVVDDKIPDSRHGEDNRFIVDSRLMEEVGLEVKEAEWLFS